MFRFFVQKKIGNKFVLSKETINHLKVVRKTHQKFIVVFDKRFFVCHLEEKFAVIDEILSENHEFRDEVVLAACILKTKAWELLLQKATELGVTKIIPVLSQNVVQKFPSISSKLER